MTHVFLIQCNYGHTNWGPMTQCAAVRAWSGPIRLAPHRCLKSSFSDSRNSMDNCHGSWPGSASTPPIIFPDLTLVTPHCVPEIYYTNIKYSFTAVSIYFIYVYMQRLQKTYFEDHLLSYKNVHFRPNFQLTCMS